MRSSFAATWIRSLTKTELGTLIDDVKCNDVDAMARAVEFLVSESFGIWHNRARAKLCRYFKNHPPADRDVNRMVDAIISRLIDGRFYEQFKDQLSMAIRLDPKRMAEAAMRANESDREYVRRYADWLSHALNSSSTGAVDAHDASTE